MKTVGHLLIETLKAFHVPKHCKKNNDLQLCLSDKGLNFGHLNIQGICGRDMSKFSEIKAILNVNKNLHILGLSETKLKSIK